MEQSPANKARLAGLSDTALHDELAVNDLARAAERRAAKALETIREGILNEMRSRPNFAPKVDLVHDGVNEEDMFATECGIPWFATIQVSDDLEDITCPKCLAPRAKDARS